MMTHLMTVEKTTGNATVETTEGQAFGSYVDAVLAEVLGDAVLA